MLRSTALMMLAFAFAAPAAAEAPMKGSFEGQAFEYSTRKGAKDSVVIEGRMIKGDRFRFTVRRTGSVVGQVGDQPVAFTVSKAQRDRLAQSLTKNVQVAKAGTASFSAGTN